MWHTMMMFSSLRSTTTATGVVKRCFSSTLGSRGRQLATPPLGAAQRSASSWATGAGRNQRNHVGHSIRCLSIMPPPPTATPPGGTLQPPKSLTPEAGLGAQSAMKLFIEHGLGKQKLQLIAAEKDKLTLVERWQKMVATYIETQCHVIALLGYKPDEQGITLYTQQLSAALQLSPPEVQEELRVSGRDTYRMVLGAAFDIPTLLEDQKAKGEMTVVDARNVMHKVSLRMQEPDVLEKVAKKCSVSVAMNDSAEAQQIDLARKHTVVQEVMVSDVYLSKNGGVSLVEECGFGEGEEGYVRLQCALAEHQGDPLITQYVGSAMMKLLQSAGIDLAGMQRQAAEQ